MPIVLDGTAGITTSNLGPAALVTASEGLRSSDNDTSLPTTAATISYVAGYTATAASTSGTQILFGSIPAGISRITILFLATSQTDNTSNGDMLVQIGSGGTAVTTGYNSTSSTYSVGRTSTAGFLVINPGSATSTSGTFYLNRSPGTNTWIAHGHAKTTAAGVVLDSWGDAITIGAALDIVRITTVGGTPTFDGGSISIRCEY